jgi:hypothetical protein
MRDEREEAVVRSTDRRKFRHLAGGLVLALSALSMLAAGLTGAAPSTAAVTSTPAIGAWLSAVSCQGPTWCMAVGGYVGTLHKRHALAEVWNGTTWRVLKDVPGTSMHSVSCSASWFCMAQGSAGTQTWNGRAWQKIAGPSKQAGPISCGGKRLCAVLSHGTVTTQSVGEIWNGRTWRTWPDQTTQCEGGPPGPCGLYGLSCGNAVNCMAVGTMTADNEGDQYAEGVDWTGKSWTRAGSMPWDGDPLAAYAVSCASYFCMALGGAYQETASGDIAGAAIWTRKSSWQNASPSLGTICGGYGTCGWTSQISCGDAANCMTFSGHGDLDWNGSTWNNDPTVSAGPKAHLAGLSCHGSWCVSVGSQEVSGVQEPLAELFNGTSWSIVPAPQ